jgi:hypothetical protein
MPLPSSLPSRHVRVRPAVAALALLVAAACDDGPGANRPPLAVSVTLSAATLVPPTFVAEVGGVRVRTTARAVPQMPAEVQVRAPRLGEVPARVALLGAAGDTLAAATFTHRFERGARHWISGWVGTRRPVGLCLGWVVATPLRGSTPDSLFVSYGWLPEGAVC